MENNDVLMHYGRKGMKWYQSIYGSLDKRRKAKVRKEAAQKAQETRRIKKEEEDKKKKHESAKLEALKKGSASDILKFKGEISNEDMQKAIDRLILEQRLSELSKPKEISKGKSAAKKYIGESAKKIAVDTSVDIASQAFKYYLAKEVNKRIGDKNGPAVYTNNKRKS